MWTDQGNKEVYCQTLSFHYQLGYKTTPSRLKYSTANESQFTD